MLPGVNVFIAFTFYSCLCEGHGNATGHLRYQSALSRHAKLSLLGVSDQTHTLQPSLWQQVKSHLSSTLTRIADPAGPADTSVKVKVGIVCCACAFAAYVLCFALLIVWWRTHPLKYDLDVPERLERMKRARASVGGSPDNTPRRLSNTPRRTFAMLVHSHTAHSSDAEHCHATMQASNEEIIETEHRHVKIQASSEEVIGTSNTEVEEHSENSEGSQLDMEGCQSIWTNEDHIQIASDELIDAVGISAMCMFPRGHLDGVARVPSRRAVPLLFLQAAGLQMVLLFYMWVQLTPRAEGISHPLPLSLICVAIYLHFLNCVQEIPYTIQIFRFFVDFHDNLTDLLWFGFVLIADGFIIPALCFVLGALYLCTSVTVADVILNSVAVSFVREIDNWIIGFNLRTTFLGGRVQSQKVQFPVGESSMQMISLLFVYYPVVPACFTLICVWVGRTLLKL